MDRLSFVVARGEAPTQFEYLEGGTFCFDPKTGIKTGRISVNSFSWFAVVVRRIYTVLTGFLTAQEEIPVHGDGDLDLVKEPAEYSRINQLRL